MDLFSSALGSSASTQSSSSSTSSTNSNSGMLTQEDFLALLTQQLSYQDPFNPVENAEMISQFASFSTVEGITNLNTQFESFTNSINSNQVLTASSMVGQQVLIPTSVGHSNGTGFAGTVALTSNTSSMKVTIESEAGEVLKTIELGAQSSGAVKFDWDGTDSSGNVLPEGTYVVKCNVRQDGEAVQMPTALYSTVESVSVGSNGVLLNLRGLGSATLQDIVEIAGKDTRSEVISG